MSDDLNPYRSPSAGNDGWQAPRPGDDDPGDFRELDPPAALLQLVSYAHVAEAHLCQSVLREHGIESSLENEAAIGVNQLWSNAVGGVKVFVLRDDLPRATELLVSARAAMEARASQGPITFHCEECNAAITFPGNRRGHVETCPKCHEYVDVPD